MLSQLRTPREALRFGDHPFEKAHCPIMSSVFENVVTFAMLERQTD